MFSLLWSLKLEPKELLVYFGIAVGICTFVYQIVIHEQKEADPAIINSISYNVMGRMSYLALGYLWGVGLVLLHLSALHYDWAIDWARFIAFIATYALILLWTGFVFYKAWQEIIGVLAEKVSNVLDRKK